MRDKGRPELGEGEAVQTSVDTIPSSSDPVLFKLSTKRLYSSRYLDFASRIVSKYIAGKRSCLLCKLGGKGNGRCVSFRGKCKLGSPLLSTWSRVYRRVNHPTIQRVLIHNSPNNFNLPSPIAHFAISPAFAHGIAPPPPYLPKPSSMPPSTPSECANPLLLAWVKEWLDKARERNSKGVTTYKNAYNSLKACPIPFTHPSEAKQLTGFGDLLCKRLTDKLKDYCEDNDLPMPDMPQKQRKRKSKDVEEEDEDGEEEPAPKKKAKKPKSYVPALRSGPYALLLALSTINENSSTGLTKAETIELAEPFCNSSFTAAEPGQYYTAWNSMKTLIGKDLVSEKGRPTKRYMLTDEGWDTVKRIKKSSDPSQGRMDTFIAADPVAPGSPKANDDFIDLDSPPRRNARPASESPTKFSSAFADIIPQGETISSTSALPSFTPIVLKPGSFTVELVLDVREIRAKTDRDYMKENLLSQGVKPIMRALDLGDILWVAKITDPNLLSRLGAEGDEIMLDYIVERKRLDDLVSSIKDGRFHEQKFRLRKSGIKNVIYIIEEITMNSESISRYEEAVQSAIAGTQVVEGYFVKKTQKMDDSIRYLVSMTKLLKKCYEDRSLHLIPTNVITTGNYMPLVKHLREDQPGTEYHITYSAFASLSSKSETLTLRDIYLKMLMCTRGLTGEKALEVQKRWKTPNAFVEAFKTIGVEGRLQGLGEVETRKRKMELVSEQMGNLVGRKKIAKALSVKIAEVWGDVVLG